jgi:hypothetical protein
VSVESEKEEGRGNVIISQQKSVIDQERGAEGTLKGDLTLLGSSAVESLSSGAELSAVLELGFSVLLVLLLLGEGTGLGSLSVRIQLEHDILVLERVSLLGEDEGLTLDRGLEDRLHLIRVDDTSKVGVGHGAVRKVETILLLGGGVIGPEESVELVESTLGPDAEASEMSTRGELEEVEVVNRGELNTRKISEALVKTFGLIEDDKRTASLSISAVSGLTDTALELARLLGLLDISVGTEFLQESLGILGAADFVEGIIEHQWKLRNLIHTVSTSHDEGRDSRSGKS